MIFEIFFVVLFVEKCNLEFMPSFHRFNPSSPPLVPICPLSRYHNTPLAAPTTSKNTTVFKMPKDNFKFLLPFLDMEIQCDRNVHIMHEAVKQQIYVLHGHELYQLFLNRQEKRLSLLAILEGSVRHMEPLAAQIIYWHSNFLLVIALDEHLEVYQLPEHDLINRAEIVKDALRPTEPMSRYDTIQKLTLTGKFQKLFLFSPTKERVMIAAAVNFTKSYGKLRIFEWFNTYFEPIEEITVPVIHVVNVIGAHKKYLVVGRTIEHQTRTILTIYEINPQTLKLLAKQTLTVESRVVHMFTYKHRNMIVACSNEQKKCSSFRQMPDGQFSVYRHRTSKEFAFDHMSSSSGFVSAARQNQLMIFTNHRLDCYASFMSEEADVTDIIGYQNEFEEHYVVLVYKRPYNVLVRIVELEITSSAGNQTEADDILPATRHQHLFESTVGQLHSLLLQREATMEIFRKVSNILTPKLKNLIIGERTVLREGNVGIINVSGKYLRSPKQLLKRIENLRRDFLLKRLKRSDNQSLFNISFNAAHPLKVHTIRVENLIYQGDVLEGFSLNQTNLKQKVLTIKPKVITRSLNTTDLIIFPQNVRNIREQTTPVSSSVRVTNLNVDVINGLPWRVFYDSLFLKDRHKLIKGRLIIQAPLNVNNLTTKILNGLVVANLFNLREPQVILANLVISRLFFSDLKAKTVNGLVFEDDIVFSGHDTFIETPVIMHHLSVSGDLFWANNTKLERLPAEYDEMEFKQFYTNKVFINGSLIVNNLRRLKNTTKIILGDREFDEQKIKEKYLLKEEAQTFSFPVNFGEAKVTAPYLQTNYLNDHKTEEHMLVNKLNTTKPLFAWFTNAHVRGDVICRDYKSMVAEIKENIVRPGDRVNITGIKVFEAPLEILNVETVSLNQLLVKDLVFKSLLNDNETVKFHDAKAFTAIRVKNTAFIDSELQASYLNRLPLENLLHNNYYQDRLHVKHLLEALNLVFHKINGIPFDEFFTKLDVRDGDLVLHKDVVVEGNVQFSEALETKYINGIAWNKYVDNLAFITERNLFIEGDVSFDNDLIITKDLETTQINSSDLKVILQNVLMKSKPQLITGRYHFGHMSGSNIDVSVINGINIMDFVDLSKNLTIIEGDIIVERLHIGGNLRGNMQQYESLLALAEKVQQLPMKPWKNLYVLNSVSWPVHVKSNAEHELMEYFYKYAVRSNQDQIITGNAQLVKPLILNMKTHLKFQSNLDIDFLKQDALLKNSSERQTIRGEKVFLKPVYMETLKAEHHLNTKLLNDIDILRFNQSLYRLTSREPLQAILKFQQPLTVGHLQVNGLINGLNTTVIYELRPGSPLPWVALQELYIENNLYIKTINDMSLEYFLDNRVTLKGPALEHFGVLTFENLIIEKEALIKSINDIPIDNMVFKHSSSLQTITGHKTIGKALTLVGPANIMRINNKDLIELQRSSLMKDQNYQFDELLIDQATFEQGLVVVTNINNNIRQRSLAESEADTAGTSRESFLRFLREFKANLTSSNKAIMYLDYDPNTNIKWLDSGHTQVNQTIRHELSRISFCEKEYIQISWRYPNNFYLKNTTTNLVSAISSKISVKAENFCKLETNKVKSKITISRQKLLKVFAMKRFIETIHTLDLNGSSDCLVILHAIDLPQSLRRNEVRIFKIIMQNNAIREWQSLKRNIGEILKLFKFSNLHVLITNGLNHSNPAVTIYHFNHISQLFEVQQVIDGDYDIIEMLETSSNAATKQLILSCSKCQSIFVYELNSSQTPQQYEILQIISLNSSIDKLVVFSLNNESYILTTSKRDVSLYNIYKYSYMQGWLLITYGYFPNSQLSIPLTEMWTNDQRLVISKNSDGKPLMLLCDSDNCYLVKVLV